MNGSDPDRPDSRQPASGSPRRPRNRRGEGHRLAEEIVAAARSIIEQTGDESRVTLSEVARRVGIAVPSIYPHFANSAAICRAVVQECVALYVTNVVKPVDVSAGLAAAVSDWARRYVAFGREYPGVYRVIHARDNSREMADVGAASRNEFDLLIGALAQLYGEPPDSVVAREAAVALWIELHGIVLLPPAHPRFEWPSDEQLVRLALRHAGIGGNAHAGGTHPQ